MKRRTILIVTFLAGLSSLIYEIYCLKVLFLFYSETIFAASLTIAAFLSGLAFSSLFFSSKVKSREAAVGFLCMMNFLLIGYALIVLNHYFYLPTVLDGIDRFSILVWQKHLFKSLFVFIYLFVPAFFIGGTFPVLNGLYLSTVEAGVQETGRVYFVDMLGAIGGVLLAGFILIPYLGFEKTLWVAVMINILTVTILLSSPVLKKLIFLFLAILSVWVVGGSPWSEKRDGQKTESPSKKESLIPYQARFGQVIFQKSSPFGVVTVGQNAYGVKGNKTLFINYRPMCGYKDRDSEEALGLWVAEKGPADSRVLNIGLGCGYTAESLAIHPNVSKVDIIEINPVVAQACREYFSLENKGVLGSPKANLIIEDGANYIRKTKEIYDAIVIDIEEVRIIHSSPLFTKEYFKIYHDRLKPGGIFAVWAMGDNPKFAKVLYNTVQSVFPYVQMRIFSKNTYIFYGSSRELEVPLRLFGEEERVEAVLRDENQEINTLDNRCLEKYSDLYRMFSLPIDSRESFVRKE